MTSPEAQGHTPAPWAVGRDGRSIVSDGGKIVLHASARIVEDREAGDIEPRAVATIHFRPADIELAVTAVNSHASLKQRVEELEAAAADALAGWQYIRKIHGDLYGVGWDRVEEALTKALSPRGET